MSQTQTTPEIGASEVAPRKGARRRFVGQVMRSLLAVIVGTLILRLAAQTMGQMLQFYLDEIDQNYYPISHTERGFILASFFATEMGGALVLGALSDRYGRKIFILLGPLLGAIAVQITSMTVAVWILVITRLLEGLSTGSSVPATLGYISDVTSGRPKLRARIVGLFEITLVGGMALGYVAGGYLWAYFGQPANFLGMRLHSPAFALNGLIYLASLAVFVWGLRDFRRRSSGRNNGGHGNWREYREMLKSPRVWLFIPAWLAVFAIIGMWSNHGMGLLKGEGIATEKIGNVSAILTILFAVGVLVWSFNLARYRKTGVMLVAMGGLFVALAAGYGLNHPGPVADALFYPLAAALLIGLFVLSGFTPAALTYLADVTESHANARGSIMGLYSVFLGVGQVIGITTGGFFATWAGIDGLLLLSAIFGVLTTFTLMPLRRQEAVS